MRPNSVVHRLGAVWHHCRVTRWIAPIVLACFVFASGDASAQVFKPRGGGSAKSTPAKKTTPAPKKGGKKVVTTKAPKKSSRVASKGRPSDLTPDKDSTPSEEEDYVEIIDDDE